MSLLLNKKLWLLLLLLFAVVLPFGPAIPNIMIGVVGFYWLLHLGTGRLQFSKKNVTEILIFSAFCIACGISYFYSEDIAFYTKKIALLAPLFVFPLFVITMPYRLEKNEALKIGLGLKRNT